MGLEKGGSPPNEAELVRDGEGLRPGARRKSAGLLAALGLKLGIGSGTGSGLSSVLAVLSTNTGFAAVLLLGYGAAVGIGMLSGDGESSGSNPRRAGSFTERSLSPDSAGSETVLPGADSETANPSSLQIFRNANLGEGDGVGAGAAGEAGEGKSAAPVSEAKDSGVESPDNSNAESSASAASVAAPSTGPKPQLVRAKGVDALSSGGASRAQLNAQADVSGGRGGGSDGGRLSVSNTGSLARGSSPAGVGRGMFAAGRGDKSASRQALNVKKTTENSLLRGNLSSAQAGLPYDGGRGAAVIGAAAGKPAGGGAGLGGEGLSSKPNANTVHNLKEIKPPPPVEKKKNKTPYQRYVKRAMISLAAATAALMVAGILKSKADQLMATDPPAAATLMFFAKAMSAAAVAVAGYCAAMGMKIMGFHGQTMQGLMFITTGGIVAVRALMVMIDSTSAKKAPAEVAANATSLTSETTMLKGQTFDANPGKLPLE